MYTQYHAYSITISTMITKSPEKVGLRLACSKQARTLSTILAKISTKGFTFLKTKFGYFRKFVESRDLVYFF